MKNGAIGARTPTKNTAEIIPLHNVVTQGVGHGFALTFLGVLLCQPLRNNSMAFDNIVKKIYLLALEGSSTFGADIVALTNQLLVYARMQCCTFYQLGFGFLIKIVRNVSPCGFFFRGGRGKCLKSTLVFFVFLSVPNKSFYILKALAWMFFNFVFYKAVKIVAVKLRFGVDANVISIRIRNIQ